MISNNSDKVAYILFRNCPVRLYFGRLLFFRRRGWESENKMFVPAVLTWHVSNLLLYVIANTVILMFCSIIFADPIIQ